MDSKCRLLKVFWFAFLIIPLFLAYTHTANAADQEQPYFRACNVHLLRTSGGVQTTFYAEVYNPSGALPGTIIELRVTYPDGTTYQDFTPSEYLGSNNYYLAIPGQAPPVGEYTFTVTDAEGHTAITHFYYGGGPALPVPDPASLQASGDESGGTLSWGGLAGYEGNVFYRGRIFDHAYNIIWTSGFVSGTSVSVPGHVMSQALQDPEPRWRVEAFDNHSFTTSYSRSNSNLIDLALDNHTPYFDWATILHRQDTTAGPRTQLEVFVKDPDGDLPSSIQSLDVYDSSNQQIASLNDFIYDPYWSVFFALFPGSAEAGVYRFVVTDQDSKTKTTYDYIAPVYNIPIVDSATYQASGDPLAPVLSWAAPPTVNGPVYYQVIIEDSEYVRAWGSDRTTETSVQAPPGRLQPGVSYTWYIRTTEDKNYLHYSHQGRSPRVTLSVNPAPNPYFSWAGVHRRHDADGAFTGLSAAVIDPSGTLPGSLTSLAVQTPLGDTHVLVTDGGLEPGVLHTPQWSEFLFRAPGPFQPGLYTFTLVKGDFTLVSHDWVEDTPLMPLVDKTSITVSGNPAWPTVSWSGVSGFEGNVYYRLRVDDTMGNLVHMSSRDHLTAQKIPAGNIEPGKTYRVRVEAQEHPDWIIYNSRSNSASAFWIAPEESLTSLSGKVTDREGTPLQGVLVRVFSGKCWNTLVGEELTNDYGDYLIQYLPGGEDVFVQACATCNHLNYVDAWYDWREGNVDCNGAAPVYLYPNRELKGIDLSLRSGPRRNQFVEVFVNNGNLWTGFGVLPGFREGVVGATVTFPNPARQAYSFDLLSDTLMWDSECRYINLWGKNFGSVQTEDYGEYIFTVRFLDGAEESHSWHLKKATVIAVEESSIEVDVNDDGSVLVSWDRPLGVSQYYQVRVSDGTKELFRSDAIANIDHLFISADALRCLEKDVSYFWRVRVYDDVYPLYNVAETRSIFHPYDPGDLFNRIRYAGVQQIGGGMIEPVFMVRAGSREHIEQASVSGPGGFAYTFNLSADRFDLSTETRLGLTGWTKLFPLGPESYGTYTFEVRFDDGYTQTLDRTLNPAEVVPVDAGTMSAMIHPDGAVTFSWDLPTGNPQKYEVRIRSLDGSKEYYNSGWRDWSPVTASGWDLRALEQGKIYRWFVRAYDAGNNRREQSGILYFLYDPFGERIPGDLNGNGAIDLGDAVMALQIVAGKKPSGFHAGRDLNADGRIGMVEVLYILQHVAGLR